MPEVKKTLFGKLTNWEVAILGVDVELQWAVAVQGLVVGAEELVAANGESDHYWRAWGNTPGGKKSEVESGDTDPVSTPATLKERVHLH